jgi:hypothetical protein
MIKNISMNRRALPLRQAQAEIDNAIAEYVSKGNDIKFYPVMTLQDIKTTASAASTFGRL